MSPRRKLKRKEKAGDCSRTTNMRLAELIHKAVTDPGFRLALESGTIGVAHPDLRQEELEALSEVMQRFKSAAPKKVLADIHALRLAPDWRED